MHDGEPSDDIASRSGPDKHVVAVYLAVRCGFINGIWRALEQTTRIMSNLHIRALPMSAKALPPMYQTGISPYFGIKKPFNIETATINMIKGSKRTPASSAPSP